jgi:hypothetical protein
MKNLPDGFKKKGDPSATLPPPGREMTRRRTMVSNWQLLIALAGIGFIGALTAALVVFAAGGNADPKAATMFEVYPGPLGVRIKNLDLRPALSVSVVVNEQWEGTMPIDLAPKDDGVMPFALLLNADGLRFDPIRYGIKEVKLRARGAIEWQTFTVR